MPRRLLLAESLTLAVAFALSLAHAATARADDVVLVPNSTVKNALGGRIKGAIQSESPTEVVVKLGANTTTVPTGEIASVKYDNQPPSLILAQSKESAGLLAEASDLYKKAVGEASGKPFIAQAAQFHQAYALAAAGAVRPEPRLRGGQPARVVRERVPERPPHRRGARHPGAAPAPEGGLRGGREDHRPDGQAAAGAPTARPS